MTQFFSRATSPATASLNQGPLKRLRQRMASPAIILSTLMINLFALALPIVILQVYDRIVPNNATETMLLLMSGLVVVLIFDSILRCARSYLTGWVGMQFEHDLGCHAVDRLLRTSPQKVEKQPVGNHIDQLASIDQLRDFYAGQGALLVIDLPFVLIYLGLLAAIGQQLIFVVVALLLVLAAIAFLIGRSLHHTLEQRNQVDDRRLSFIIELLQGIHTVKSMAMEALMLRRYERLLEGATAAAYTTAFYSGLSQAVGAVFSQIVMAIVVATGAFLVIDGNLTVGGLAAATMLAGRSLQPLIRAMNIWSQFQSIRIAKERAAELFELEPERTENTKIIDEIDGKIEIKDLSFGYDNSELLFEKLNLQVPKGGIVAITGPNGCGKTTLLQLIIGILTPTKGKISIDDHDLQECDVYSLRQHIAFLPQVGHIFRGSIMDNITMFRGDDHIDEAIWLSSQCGLDEYLAKLPKGFDTPVGEGANEVLPGGVRQRITIMRELMGSARVILFDEANAMLDRSSDERLIDLLELLRGNSTMVLVTYRPSIMRMADKVYEINGKQLVERPIPQSPHAPQQDPQKVASNG